MTAWCGARLVAATTRRSSVIARCAPRRSTVPSCSTRSSLACKVIGISVSSSKNNVPPLRERREDIRVLAEHFLHKYCNELGRPPPCLDEGAVQHLLAYSWPGNVRELQNLMERLAVLSRADVIDVRQLPQELAPSVVTAVAAPDMRESLLLRPQVDALERRLIQEALTRTADNKSAASRLLGLRERAAGDHAWVSSKKRHGLLRWVRCCSRTQRRPRCTSGSMSKAAFNTVKRRRLRANSRS